MDRVKEILTYDEIYDEVVLINNQSEQAYQKEVNQHCLHGNGVSHFLITAMF